MTTPTRKALQDILDKIDSAIEEQGWAYVMTSQSPGSVPFLYTIGLTEMDLPELVIFGLDQPTARAIAERAMEKLKQLKRSGHPIQDGLIGDQVIAGSPVVFREIPWGKAASYVRVAKARYQRKLEVMQIVLPDANGRFPWEPGCDEQFVSLQSEAVKYQNNIPPIPKTQKH